MHCPLGRSAAAKGGTRNLDQDQAGRSSLIRLEVAASSPAAKGQSEKLVPQPQDAVACGLMILKA